MKTPALCLSFAALLSFAGLSRAETPAVPDWALPGSATHKQVPPPKGFHRATRTETAPIGIFDGQSDVGGALVAGSAKYDAATRQYTIDSAGYNIWYNRDEFHYLWKKIDGDFTLACDIAFPKPDGYDDRKVVLIARQDLDDDGTEAMTALHGAGLIHLAYRPEKDTDIKEATRTKVAKDAHIRLGIQKHGDTFTLLVGENGGPLKPVGNTATLHLEKPFYVGIGFTSHLPVTVDEAVVSNVELDAK
jgi:hypothetical protein